MMKTRLTKACQIESNCALAMISTKMYIPAEWEEGKRRKRQRKGERGEKRCVKRKDEGQCMLLPTNLNAKTHAHHCEMQEAKTRIQTCHKENNSYKCKKTNERTIG